MTTAGDYTSVEGAIPSASIFNKTRHGTPGSFPNLILFRHLVQLAALAMAVFFTNHNIKGNTNESHKSDTRGWERR
jgi:hypothetical protein